MKSKTGKTKASPRAGDSALVKELREHQRELWPFTRKYIGKTQLDIGCGNGITSVIQHKELGVAPTLCDVADIREAVARKLPFKLIKLGRLPFPDGAFDTSYIQYVLHHLPAESEVEKLLAEAGRVARRIIIVEEIAGKKTKVERAKAFDREVNERIHPGSTMPVYKYYTVKEIERFFKKLKREVVFHAVVAKGNEGNGFLETQVFVAE